MRFSTKTRRRGTPRSIVAALTLLFASSLFLAACGGGEFGEVGGDSGTSSGTGDSGTPAPQTASVVVSAGVGGGLNALTAFNFGDVVRVDVTVVADGDLIGGPQLGFASLTSPDFLETITGLPIDTPLEFYADGFDGGNTVIFTNDDAKEAAASPTPATLLVASPPAIELELVARDDGTPQAFPIITGMISNTSPILLGSSGVQFTLNLSGASAEGLFVDFDHLGDPGSPSGTIADTPLVPVVMDIPGIGSAVFNYTTATVAQLYPHTVRVENSQGNSIVANFDINVAASGAGGAVNFAPTFQTEQGVAGTTIIRVDATTATVGVTMSDENTASLHYAWAWTSISGPTASIAVPDANPVTLTISGGSGALTGTLSLTVTDEGFYSIKHLDGGDTADGLSTTANFANPVAIPADLGSF